jgi:hypothetical protein
LFIPGSVAQDQICAIFEYRKEHQMSNWITGVMGALVVAGSSLVAAEPAQARVSVGIGIGIPGPYYGPGYGYAPGYDRACDRYSRWYDPYRCDAEYYDDGYYDGPVFIDGIWFDGRFRHRHHHGHQEFFFRDHWHEGRMGDHDHHHDFGGEGHHHHR